MIFTIIDGSGADVVRWNVPMWLMGLAFAVVWTSILLKWGSDEDEP